MEIPHYLEKIFESSIGNGISNFAKRCKNNLEKSVAEFMEQNYSKLEKKKISNSIVKELKRLEDWQTQYFKRFIDYSQIIKKIDKSLKVEISEKKIAIHGERKSVEEAYEKIDQIIDSIQRKEIDIEPCSLIEYFISSDLIKLNRLVEYNELKIMLIINKSKGFIYAIGTKESDLEELNQLISSRFCTQEYIIDKSLIDLVKSRKFEESIEKKQIELNIPEEERKSMIRITDREIICTGETHLIDELMVHFSVYLDGNKIMSCDYTNRYQLEILKYFERVIYDDLERDLNNGIVDSDLQMKQILELNSSDNSPRLLIKVPFKDSYLVKKYLNIFDQFAHYMTEQDYSIHTKFPLSELADQKHILESIKSIENQNRCVISHNTEEKVYNDQSDDQFSSCKIDRCRLEAASIGQLNLIEYDYIVNVNVDNENLDSIAMKFFVDFQNFIYRPWKKSHRKIVIYFNKTQFFENFTCRNLILSKILDLLSGLSALDNLNLIAFACEQATLIQPILYNFLRYNSRSKFQKTALISKPIGNLQSSFYIGERNKISSTGNNKNCLKFTIRSNNKACIEKCKFELSQMVNKLVEPIKTEVRYYDWFEASNNALINQVEKICSNNRVVYEWSFEKQIIAITGKHENTSNALKQIDEFDLGLRHYEMKRLESQKNPRISDTYWMSTKNFDLVSLDPNSMLYNEKLAVFISMDFNYKNILSIDRIENRYLYSQYMFEKEHFENKNINRFEIEHNLFHGTSGDCVQSITKSGFNRSYAGKNASSYGKGVYFACSASYSHKFTDIVKKGKSVGHMFLCRVLVGDYTLGKPTMTVPPENFDSTTDCLIKPSMYVIYKDTQAYPDYLITYQ